MRRARATNTNEGSGPWCCPSWGLEDATSSTSAATACQMAVQAFERTGAAPWLSRPVSKELGVGAGFDDRAVGGEPVDDGCAEPGVGEGLGRGAFLRPLPGGRRGEQLGRPGRITQIRDNAVYLSVDDLGLSLRQRIAYTETSLPSPAATAPLSPHRSRRGPRRRRPAKLQADKGYDYDHLRKWLRERRIRHRIARKGIESSTRLGRHRWVVGRTVSWLAGCRRLHRRYERKAEHFLAFVGIAAALITYRRLGAPLKA